MLNLMIKIEILGKSWEFNISFYVIYFSLAFCDFSLVTLFTKDRYNLLSNFTSLCNYKLFKRLEFYKEFRIYIIALKKIYMNIYKIISFLII